MPALPCVIVNPGVPASTPEVFGALGLRRGELRAGVADVLRAPAWPETGASIEDWIAALADGTNDLEAAAIEVAPAIEDTLTELRGCDGVQLARMSGSGATCFALWTNAGAATAAAQRLRAAHPQWWVHAGKLG